MANANATGRKLLYGLPEAARLIGWSPQKVRSMCYEGLLRYERHGRNFMIYASEIERLRGTDLGPSEEERGRRELWNRLHELRAEEAMVIAQLSRLE